MQRTAPAAGRTDFALWVCDQAAALRDGRFGDVDVAATAWHLDGDKSAI